MALWERSIEQRIADATLNKDQGNEQYKVICSFT